MADGDKELDAIKAIIEALSGLDASERDRVLEYVLKRLDLEQPGPRFSSMVPIGGMAEGPAASPYRTDIRTLTVEKKPRSANEMVALTAYYLSEIAREGEASQTVNADLVRKYFKMAQFPMPRSLKSALTNASAAGYLENVSRGEYKLNPVGYNLVVHGMPRSANPHDAKSRRSRS